MRDLRAARRSKGVTDSVAQCLRMTLSTLAIVALSASAGCSWRELSREPSSPLEARRYANYTVRYGDTLALIAKRSDIPLATLVAANDLAPPYAIYTDEVLRLPLGVSVRRIWPSPRRPEGTIAERDVNAESMAYPPQQKPAGPSIDGEHHTVRPGDSLSAIASRHRLSIGDLVAVNGIAPPYRLYPGQRLTIPPSEDMLQQRAEALRENRSQQTQELTPPPPLSPDGFLWPVEGAVIRTFNQNSAQGQSGAVNIAARLGTPVRATNDGIVAFAGEALDRYGQMIVLRHAGGYVSLYAHNGALLVEEGDIVHRGQVITEVGQSGDVADGQLRFELRSGMEPIDPLLVMAGQLGSMTGAL